MHGHEKQEEEVLKVRDDLLSFKKLVPFPRPFQRSAVALSNILNFQK